MVRNVGCAYRTEQDGVEAFELLHAVVGHEAASPLVAVRTPVELFHHQLEGAASTRRRFQRLAASGDDLDPDSIARDHRN
jgi:hypothetical protein